MGDQKKIKFFEDLFSRGIFQYKDLLYQSWLVLKFGAVGREDEALDHVLRSRNLQGVREKKEGEGNCRRQEKEEEGGKTVRREVKAEKDWRQ